MIKSPPISWKEEINIDPKKLTMILKKHQTLNLDHQPLQKDQYHDLDFPYTSQKPIKPSP